MNRAEKKEAVKALKEQLEANENFYLADISGLDAKQTYNLRKEFFENNITITVVKNTLLKRAFEEADITDEGLLNSIKGSTSLIFSEEASTPARVIKKMRKTEERPVLKVAYVYESFYIGDENIEYLSSIKSKEEVISDILSLLQSPAKNVISSLKSSGNTITGILKTLSERE